MSDDKKPKVMLRLAPWWVMAVVAGYLFFNVWGSRAVQNLLHR